MKRTLNSRRSLTFVTIGIVGLFLFLLVSPSFLGVHTITLQLLVIIFSLLPLLIITTAISYVFGRAVKNTKPKPANNKEARFLAASVAAATIGSIGFAYLSTQQPQFTSNTYGYVFENIGTGLIFTSFVAATVLINMQEFVYWPFWNKSDKASADERQLFVRQRVFEKTYRYSLLVLMAAGLLTRLHLNRLNMFVFGGVVLALLSLPACIAAWQRDS